MIAAIEKLFYYFGYVGLASIVVWLAAVALMAAFAVRWRSSAVCWTAFALAIVGLVLANINSHFVSDIKIDFSQELSQAKQRAKDESGDVEPEVESDISAAAEEARRQEAAQPSPADSQPDDGGAGDTDVGDTDEQQPSDPASDASTKEAAKDEPTSDQPAYDYRSAGKAERTEGKQVAERIPIDSADAVVTDVRMMKNHEVMHANRLDRLNLVFARSTLLLAVCLVIVDYLRRFNSTFDCYLPVPLGGRLVDSLFRKSHSVADTKPDRDWKTFLERAVRKGETFILFSDSDPWPDQKLSRLPRYLDCLPCRVEKVRTDSDENRFDDDFLFESAWFGRYCFVVVGDGATAVQRLEAIVESLELRGATRAAARQTLNLVWSFSIPIPRETLDRLLPLCGGTNVKLIVAQSQTDESLADRFEEACA